MKTVQVLLALLTIASAVAAVVIGHVFWLETSVRVFAFVDAPMILAMLGGLLAVAIAFAPRSEWTLTLIPVNVLVVSPAIVLFFGNPLAVIPALLLLLTTIASGVTMTRVLWSEPA